VPALDPDAGIDFVGKDPAYGKTKRDEYTEKDYHAPSDEVKPDWESDRRRRGCRVAARGWLPGRECPDDARMETGQRVQGET
jgi:hypothetical protein